MKQKVHQDSDLIDLKAFFLKLYHHWYYFVIALAVTLSLAFLYINFADRIYSVKAVLMVRDKSNSTVGAENLIESLEIFSVKKNIDNEIMLLKSADMISQAIKELDFDVSYYTTGDVKTNERYGNFPFKVVLDTASPQAINVPVSITILSKDQYELVAQGKNADIFDIQNGTVINSKVDFKIKKKLYFGELYKDKNFAFKIFPENLNLYKGDKLYFRINNLQELVDSYTKKLNVKAVSKEGSVLEVMVDGPIAQKEINFLNKLSEVYILSGLKEKNQIATSTINFIDDQLSGITDSLKDTESELEDFRAKNKIMDISYAANTVHAKFEKLENEKSMLDLSLKYYDFLLKYLRGNKSIKDIIAPSSIGINDPQLNNLILELTKHNQERTTLAYTTTKDNPYLEILDLKIKNAKETLIENLQNIINSSKVKEKEINQRLQELEASLSELPKTERSLIDIQRRFKLNDHIYNYLLEKKAEAGIAKASNTADNRIIDRARLNGKDPISPKKAIILAFAILLGIVLPIGVISVKGMINDAIGSFKDLQRNTLIPVLGKIGRNETGKKGIFRKNEETRVAEDFNSLFVTLQYLDETQKKVIGVTSSVGKEGKSFCSSQLAISHALSGKKTILVSTHLREPEFYTSLTGMTSGKGLSSYLQQSDVYLDKIIVPASTPNLDVIPSGPVVENPTHLFSVNKLQELFWLLKERYEIIIIDGSPVNKFSEYFTMRNYIDINLYVVRHDFTTPKMLSRINGLYSERKLKNLNIIINDINTSSSYAYDYETTNLNNSFIDKINILPKRQVDKVVVTKV